MLISCTWWPEGATKICTVGDLSKLTEHCGDECGNTFQFGFSTINTYVLKASLGKCASVDGMEAGCRPSSLVLMRETGGWRLYPSPGGQAVGWKELWIPEA